ncbi:MAG: bifunctional adenosylcobinamide kinase/adenosylcobinamide-phosphate guanylyltransferase, partial [Chloroflexi bacterium]|nr:bifunctional adenosylcobinamide kinase/adenosylcobinamide-phosphate guanylyltransferase [Chloroflexota bacterium]
MGKLLLVLGGVRSGKSSYAEQRAADDSADVLYVATSLAIDEEMKARIARHRAQRPDTWQTIEEPLQIARSLDGVALPATVLIDCITVLISNLMVEATGPYDDAFDSPRRDPFSDQVQAKVMAPITELIELISRSDADFIIVSNEVGLGVVPPY